MFSIFGKRRNGKNNKGFTLVELMIVVAIMAVLVAVAIPVYNSVSYRAEKQACLTNMRIVSDTLNNYLAGYSREDSGENVDIPDFDIKCENGYPLFDPAITDPLKSRFLASVQDPISLCCSNDDGVLSVRMVTAGANGSRKVVVTCSLHSVED